ncbi:hypothetical protein DMH25_16200 [Streptomyces sp. WAC 01325]|nr:hypothetical protein DMH25_16200 [Streptomyces sp. WAC 01325]
MPWAGVGRDGWAGCCDGTPKFWGCAGAGVPGGPCGGTPGGPLGVPTGGPVGGGGELWPASCPPPEEPPCVLWAYQAGGV